MKFKAALAVVGTAVSIPVGMAVASAFLATSAPSAESTPSLALPADIAARASDPEGGDDWGMQLIESRGELPQRCYAVGVMRNGTVGAIGPTGRFVAYPVREGGTCVGASLPRSVNIAVRTDRLSRRSRIVVHGFVGADVSELTLHSNGQVVTVKPSRDRAVLHVSAGGLKARPTVSASFTDGTSRLVWQPSDAPPLRAGPAAHKTR